MAPAVPSKCTRFLHRTRKETSSIEVLPVKFRSYARSAMKFFTAITLPGLLALTVCAQAQVSSTYTVSGTSGNYLLDFSFTNNETIPNYDIYFIEFYDATALFPSGPTGWSYYGPYGGGDGGYLDYGTDIPAMVQPYGGTESGFYVDDLSVTAPTSVDYDVYIADWVSESVPYTEIHGTDVPSG
jgi:hypothetical protein